MNSLKVNLINIKNKNNVENIKIFLKFPSNFCQRKGCGIQIRQNYQQKPWQQH